MANGIGPQELLASLMRARHHGERQLNRQRQRFGLFECMRGDQAPEDLAAAILGFAVAEAGSQGGAFYLARPGRRLVLAAHRGLDPRGLPTRELRLGSGLAGMAAAARRSRTATGPATAGWTLDLPAGPAAPGGLCALPFHAGGRLKGVLVLAWSDPAAAAEPSFLAEQAGSVAVALDSAFARVRVQRLLAATRDQAVALARQRRELQATNAALARADRYKSEFLANMSHELRTPLNSMMIMSQVLAENRGGNLLPDQVEVAQTINRAGGDLLLIINDILDMTRVESGRLDLHFERVDPRGLAADLEDLFQPVAGRRGLELRVEVAPELPAILVSDPLRLSQILKNLLNNAVKFTERGSVRFTVRPAAPRERPAGPAAGDWVAFSVADTGIGMDPGTAARVCEPFFQGDGSIGRRYGGSGLGLSICARLTDLLGGRLDVESTPGRGSTFVLVLPVTAPGAARELPVRDAPAADPLIRWEGRLAGRTVLLVDGDMRTVYSLSHLLDRMQARVRIARSVAEALDQAAQEPGPDLLCVSPGLFADRPGALRQLFAGPGDRPRPCLWLGAAPADLPWLPDRTATAPMPLDPLLAAEACTRLCALDLQPA